MKPFRIALPVGFLLLLTEPLAGQTWKDLNDSLLVYFKKKEYTRAAGFGEQAVKLAKEKLGDRHEYYYLCLTNLYNAYKSDDQPRKAAPLIERILDVFRNNNDTVNLYFAQTLNQGGVIQTAMKDTARSEIYYKRALHLTRQLKDREELLESVLYNLGNHYLTTGHFADAVPLLEEMRELQARLYGKQSGDYLDGIQKLAAAYTSLEQYREARDLRKEEAGLVSTATGTSSAQYASALYELALLEEELKDWPDAENNYRTAANILKTQSRPGALLMKCLMSLGVFYENRFEYTKAISCFEELAERVRNQKENELDYAFYLNKAGLMYHLDGQAARALPLFSEVVQIRKRIGGENNEDYAVSLNNLASVYEQTGDYSKAEALYSESVRILYQLHGKYNGVYARSLNNLASIYAFMGIADKAEVTYMELLEIREKISGKQHADYAQTLNNLGLFYNGIGYYEKAEDYFLQTLQIRKKVLGETHPDYAVTLQNLAFLYSNIGNFQKAMTMNLQSLDIVKRIYGEKHTEYARALNNIGHMYYAGQQYTSAGRYLEQAVQILEMNGAASDQVYASSLSNLASVYLSTGNFEKSLSLNRKAIDNRKKYMGDAHPEYAKCLNNLAALYEQMGHYAEAESLYKETLSILEKNAVREQPGYAVILNNLALLYLKSGDKVKAAPLLANGLDILNNHIIRNFGSLSENEKENWLTTNLYQFETLLSLPYGERLRSDSFSTFILDQQLLLKSLVLSNTKGLLRELQATKDTGLQKNYAEWKSVKKELARQYGLPATERTGSLDEMEKKAEELEKQLNRQSAAFRKGQQSLRIHTEELKKELKQGEAIIEFVRFQLFSKNWKDSFIYAASVLTSNNTAPVFVPLFEEKQLQQLFDSAGTTATGMAGRFYRGTELKNKSTAGFSGTALYKLVWAPLEPFLKGIHTVHYSPAGKLYNIAFHALPVDSNRMLMDQFKLNQYTSTRGLMYKNETEARARQQDIVLFGDADFNNLTTVKSGQPVNHNYTLPSRGKRGGSWVGLPGTAVEVKKIEALFDQRKIPVQAFTATGASEENLKSLSGRSPRVLHIATHGFFLPRPDSTDNLKNAVSGNAYSLAEDPLLRSGLVLTGGNRAWKGQPPAEGVEDGIVTAYEISQLDLSQTELVVLSACETALGDVKGSEGVFGLQRAFKMAGVQKMIVSLWQVPDKETAELMTAFYGYWLGGQGINEAFARAQEEMRKKYPPFYWAAFVLVE